MCPVWDPGKCRTAKAFAAAVLAFFSLLVASCSGDTGSSSGGGDSTEGSSVPEESTVTPPPRKPETTGEEIPEATLGPERASPAVLLRLEGDRGTTFSGICTVGGKESVLSGRIPKRYAFDLRGQRLSCRIEKRDPGRGSLRVILISGDTTRSVQQTNTRGGVINVSYAGN
jgi:hypothetical protein